MALIIRSNQKTAVKICGITNSNQAVEIAKLGVDAIGVIGVKSSSRFVEEERRKKIFNALQVKCQSVERVWVVADINDKELFNGLNGFGLPSVVQLHGHETIKKCKELKESFSSIKFWKAIRIKSKDDLDLIQDYSSSVDAILIDAWSPNALGGSGNQIPVEWLKNKEFSIPWWLAGGVSPEWIGSALQEISPYGVDASSKLEVKPGEKDIKKVKSLLKIVKNKKLFLKKQE